MKFFYKKLITTTEIKNFLDKKGLSIKEKEELWILVKDTLHHRVIETVLTNLPQKHHQEFLEAFAEKPHDESVLELLKEKVADIEDKIHETVEKVKQEILADLESKD